MRLTVLVDNNTLIDKYCLAEPGLSFFLEEDGRRFLFDSGYSDVFMQNAAKLGVDLMDLDGVILSHGHNDHVWGLVPLVKAYTEGRSFGRDVGQPELYACPEAFLPKRMGELNIGYLLGKATLQDVFRVTEVREPLALSDRLVLLGPIPRVMDFEGKRPLGEAFLDGQWTGDYLMDDTALAYVSDQGLVVVTGCSHSGICNIVDYARKVCHVDRVHAIIGGFHLQHSDPALLEKTMQYLASVGVDVVYPCHCTDLQAKLYLGKELTLKEVGAGLVVEF